MKKLEKEKKKKQRQEELAKKKEEERKKKEEEEQKEYVKDPNDPCADRFGDRGLITSSVDYEEVKAKKYHRVKQIDAILGHSIGDTILHTYVPDHHISDNITQI
jgi:outer membrane biosynthesis protein TonB